MDVKGIFDERDGYRYIFRKSDVQTDELDNFTLTLTFGYFKDDVYLNDRVLGFSGTQGRDIYFNWDDLKVAYELLIEDLGIVVELPESMNWELL